MKKKRLIPILLLKNGSIVKSKQFSRYQRLGNPVTSVKRLSEWASDELIYLDITKDGAYDLNRDDLACNNRSNVLDIIRDVAAFTFMPITVGGGITTLAHVEQRLAVGADKIAINKIALMDPDFITQAAKAFGSQCVVVSIDYVYRDGKAVVYSHQDKTATDLSVFDWVKQVCAQGAGEVLINSVERDGMQGGYDMGLLAQVAELVKQPVIACGGVGHWDHFAQALQNTQVDAIAAANIFHYSDQSVYLAKKHLYELGFNLRNPELLPLERKELDHAIL